MLHSVWECSRSRRYISCGCRSRSFAAASCTADKASGPGTYPAVGYTLDFIRPPRNKLAREKPRRIGSLIFFHYLEDLLQL